MRNLILLLKKELVEVIGNKRKLWPLLLAVVPVFLLVTTEGQQSFIPFQISVYIVPILICPIITMQITSQSVLSEKENKTLDILLGTHVKPLSIVLSKIIFSTIIGLLTGIIMAVLMQFGITNILHSQPLEYGILYFVFVFLAILLAANISCVSSFLVREESAIPVISVGIFAAIIALPLYLLNLRGEFLFTNINLIILNLMLFIFSIALLVISSIILKKSKFLLYLSRWDSIYKNSIKKGGIFMLQPKYNQPEVGVCLAFHAAIGFAYAMSFCGWAVIAV